MAFGIHRIGKAKAGDLYGLELEANRTEKEKHNFPNSSIDWERTKDNYCFVKSSDWENAISRIARDHGITKTIRKDAVLMIDGLYTASPEWFEGKTPEEIKTYFAECLDFHRAHYGVVFNAVVHLDEGTPHMAVASVPLVQNKDGSYSLSAKKLLGGRVDFHERQDDFYNDVSQKYGLERGEVSTPEAKREHLDVLDYKLKVREEEVTAAEAEKIEIEKDIGKLERIREIIASVKDAACDFFVRVFSAIRTGLEKLCDKIEHNQAIKPEDLAIADCKMKKCATYTMKDGEKIPLYTPRTNAGEPLSWAGNRPVYHEGKNAYFGVCKMDAEHTFTALDSPEWEGEFSREKRDFNDSVCDRDIISLEEKIDLIDRIINEEDEDPIDNNSEDREPPEEIGFDDVEARPGREDPDEDKWDDFDIDCV